MLKFPMKRMNLKKWLNVLLTIDRTLLLEYTNIWGENSFTLGPLLQEYKMNAEKKEIRAGEIPYFSNKFHEENSTVIIPRKDQYDLCESFRYEIISRDE